MSVPKYDTEDTISRARSTVMPLCLRSSVYTSANRDEAVFADPHRFDIHRDPNPHLSFGIGEHFCLGVHLARLEARVFLDEMLDAWEHLELAGSPQRQRSNLNNSLKSLPLAVRRTVATTGASR